MKNSKLGLYVLGGTVILGGLVWVVRRAKKTVREIEQREKENKQLLLDSGLSEEDIEKIEEQIENHHGSGNKKHCQDDDVDCTVNVCKDTYEYLRFESDIELNSLDIDTILDGPSEHVVHLCQRFDKKLKRNVLDFLFEIPKSALPRGENVKIYRKWVDGNTCTGDFITQIKGKWDFEKQESKLGWIDWMTEMVKDPVNVGLKIKTDPLVNSQLEGYIFLKYESFDHGNGDWFEESRLFKIPRVLHENNPFNSDHTDLTDFIYDLRLEIESVKEDDEVKFDGLKLRDGSAYLFDPNEFRNIRAKDVICAVRVTYLVQDSKNLGGLNSNSAVKIIENIYNNMEVTGWNNGKFKYTGFLFYDPDAVDVAVFSEETNKDGKVIVVSEDVI